MKTHGRPFLFGFVATLSSTLIVACGAWFRYQTVIGVVCIIASCLLIVALQFWLLFRLLRKKPPRTAQSERLKNFTRIELFGGPFDGDVHRFPSPPIEMLGLPLSPSGVMKFQSIVQRPGKPATSIAFYKLIQHGEHWKYVYVESRPGREPLLGQNDPTIQAALEAGRRTIERRTQESRKGRG